VLAFYYFCQRNGIFLYLGLVCFQRLGHHSFFKSSNAFFNVFSLEIILAYAVQFLVLFGLGTYKPGISAAGTVRAWAAASSLATHLEHERVII